MAQTTLLLQFCTWLGTNFVVALVFLFYSPILLALFSNVTLYLPVFYYCIDFTFYAHFCLPLRREQKVQRGTYRFDCSDVELKEHSWIETIRCLLQLHKQPWWFFLVKAHFFTKFCFFFYLPYNLIRPSFSPNVFLERHFQPPKSSVVMALIFSFIVVR